jgi:hypothetical protein
MTYLDLQCLSVRFTCALSARVLTSVDLKTVIKVSKMLNNLNPKNLFVVSAVLLRLVLVLKTAVSMVLTTSTLSASGAVQLHCGSAGAPLIFAIHATT